MTEMKVPYYWVIGLGKTGVSCVKFLRKRNIAVKASDTRLSPPELASVRALLTEDAISLGGLDENLIANACKIVLSPGISLQEPVIKKAIQAGKQVVGDIQLFADFAPHAIVGITGANAKSTVSSLVQAMLSCAGKPTALGGNIGLPALELLNEKPSSVSVEAYVLELSSFQLETVHALPLEVACILNISPDHMDRYDSFEGYVAAKQKIFENAQTLVVNRDDPLTYPKHKQNTQLLLSFGLDAPQGNDFGIKEIAGLKYFMQGEQALLSVHETKLRGGHNYANILAAFCICSAMKVDLKKATDAVKTFSGLPHRCEWVGRFGGVDWINDSKGTNVGATLAAIEGFRGETTGVIHLILGGVAKGADFSPLAEAINSKIGTVFLFGEDSVMIQRHLERSGSGQRCLALVKTLQEAVEGARQIASPGDLVLFSPACASFDMFDNFEHRGEVFKQWVNEQRVTH